MHRISTDNTIATVLQYRMDGKPEFLLEDDQPDPEVVSFWETLSPLEKGPLERMDGKSLLLAHKRCEEEYLSKVRAAILVRIARHLSNSQAA